MSAAPPERRLPLPQQSSTRTPAAGSAIGSLRWFPLSVEHTCPRGKPAKQSELISRGADARIDFWVGTGPAPKSGLSGPYDRFSRSRLTHLFDLLIRRRLIIALVTSGRSPAGSARRGG